MTRQTALRLVAAVMTAGTCAYLSAQVQLPSAPPKQFGASISPAFEGWFDNADGTHSFLIGYYNRNTQMEVDVPLGPMNKFEPGNIDMGQPTHFLPKRRFGMFAVTVPKEFPKTQKITWTLTVNGVTNTTPFYMHTDYNLTPLKSSEESPNGKFNLPPVLKFEPTGTAFQGPVAKFSNPVTRTATVGTPMPLDLLVDDDALYSNGGNGPMGGARPPVSVTVSKYRGPGEVVVADRGAPKFEAVKGGKPLEDYSGKASTTVTFKEPGDYVLHVNVNDYSGNGGGGSGCCWTNAFIKVNVTGGGGAKTGGQ